MTELFSDMWSDGWLCRALAILVLIVVIFLAGALIYGCCCAADSWWLPRNKGIAEVAGHHHMDAWLQMMPCGKSVIPIYHPEQWEVTLKIVGDSHTIGVSHSSYLKMRNGDQVNVEYVVGRISHRPYIKTYSSSS